MHEWKLYAPLLAYWRERGYRAAASVTDPRGRRVELDVVAFTTDLADVRVTEAKIHGSRALVNQGVSRFAYAPRVYVAAPATDADALLDRARSGASAALGVLAVDARSVRVLRDATPRADLVEPARAQLLERVLAGVVAEDPAHASADAERVAGEE